MSIGTVNDISLHGYDASAHPFDSSSLATEGWLLFDTLYQGSIGAFYFGPTTTLVTISSPATAHYSVASPIIIHTQNAIPVSTAWGVYSIPPPNILTTNDITVDFVGVPRVGSSPLVVDFTATVTIAGSASGNVSVSEYHWYFDTDNNPTVYEISTGPTISHVYTGYYGQKFSVNLCVKLV
jgi:hypothetical protein